MTTRRITAYYRREEDGAILTRTIEAETDPRLTVRIPVPVGAVPIEADEARAMIEQHRIERQALVDRDRARRDELRIRAREQLVGLGLDEHLAQFLTGGPPT
jgi:hypothetical protein